MTVYNIVHRFQRGWLIPSGTFPCLPYIREGTKTQFFNLQVEFTVTLVQDHGTVFLFQQFEPLTPPHHSILPFPRTSLHFL